MLCHVQAGSCTPLNLGTPRKTWSWHTSLKKKKSVELHCGPFGSYMDRPQAAPLAPLLTAFSLPAGGAVARTKWFFWNLTPALRLWSLLKGNLTQAEVYRMQTCKSWSLQDADLQTTGCCLPKRVGASARNRAFKFVLQVHGWVIVEGLNASGLLTLTLSQGHLPLAKIIFLFYSNPRFISGCNNASHQKGSVLMYLGRRYLGQRLTGGLRYKVSRSMVYKVI